MVNFREEQEAPRPTGTDPPVIGDAGWKYFLAGALVLVLLAALVSLLLEGGFGALQNPRKFT